MSASENRPTRQRRAHRKSRLGCGDCKLRGVKCDESKPACKRCKASGITCSYVQSTPALRVCHCEVLRLDLTPNPAPPRYIPIILPVASRFGECELRPEHLSALDRFRNRTVLHIGPDETRHLFSEKGSGLGVSNPFLLHHFIAVALIHDSNLSHHPLNPTQKSLLSFHLYQGSAFLRQQLCTDLSTCTPSLCDALWAASALLCASTFAFLDVKDPMKAWPLKESSPDDLTWLKMADGKKAVANAFDSIWVESVFNRLAGELYVALQSEFINSIPPDVFPPQFYTVFEFDDPLSSAESNPYYTAASIIGNIHPKLCREPRNNFLFVFMNHMDDRFHALLHVKDSRALLMMAYCYSQAAISPLWWMRQRSILEGLAICTYLGRSCWNDSSILELLEGPRNIFEKAWELTTKAR